MITNIKYIASSGKQYDLAVNGVLHRTANYFSWAWGVNGTKLQFGTRVSDFSRDAAEYDAELVIYGTLEERRQIISALHNDFENDLREKKPGRLIWGDYYIDAYITQSQTAPMETWKYLNNKIHIYCPYPFWVQDAHVSLPVSSVTESAFLDYEYDYEYDYSAPVIGTKIVKSDFPFASEFKMVIFGLAVNPHITINGYPYVMNVTIPQGAYVVIDSRTKSITQYNNDGTQSNMFNYRNKVNSIFEKIPGGNLTIAWDASFGADITIFRERSEPEIKEVQ